jgi:hypothetical protein
MNATHPLELIRSLSDEEKESILMVLLREALRAEEVDQEPFRIDDENGSLLGTVTLNKYSDTDRPPRVTAEEEAEFIRRVKNPGRMLSEQEFLDWVKTVPLAEAR